MENIWNTTILPPGLHPVETPHVRKDMPSNYLAAWIIVAINHGESFINKGLHNI